MTDPNGNPGCFRDRVERLPTRPRYTNVRARSAKVGSGTGGWSVAGPGPACFLPDEVVILGLLSLRLSELFFAPIPLCRSSERPGKRQLVAVRIGHMEIAFSPRGILW